MGLTLVLPLADEEVKPPGEIEMDVAPVVDQLSELLSPEAIEGGLAEKELMVGALPEPPDVTVTLAVEVLEPEELVAVSV